MPEVPRSIVKDDNRFWLLSSWAAGRESRLIGWWNRVSVPAVDQDSQVGEVVETHESVEPFCRACGWIETHGSVELGCGVWGLQVGKAHQVGRTVFRVCCGRLETHGSVEPLGALPSQTVGPWSVGVSLQRLQVLVPSQTGSSEPSVFVKGTTMRGPKLHSFNY